MAAYPLKLTLPYRLEARYVEEHTLAGELIEPTQMAAIDLDALGSEPLRARAKALYLNVDTRPFNHTGTVEVISSGVEVCAEKRDDGRVLRMHGPIVAKIGALPLLSAPVTDPVALIEAYERWTDAYAEAARQAITDWLAAWATEDDADDDGRYPNGATNSTFITTMFLRLNGKDRHVEVDGRFDDQEHFRRVRAAYALYHYAANNVAKEDWQFAQRTVGRGAEVDEQWASGDSEVAIRAYEEYATRMATVAFARSWNRQRGKEGFDLEMRRWAVEHGSDRLNMGLADGYRMVPVYLEERIGSEAPGFYAYLPKDDDDVAWQPRTGPSEVALRWRRAAQTEIEDHCPPGMPAPTAEIVWMREPPEAMCDPEHLYEWDREGYRERVEMQPFEAIAVPGWLGRYTLLAAVWSRDFLPPAYVSPKFALRPKDYALRSLPEPPDGRLDDIPIDTGDFASAPVSPGPVDDDIPF
jgi:hypothetical protein